MVAQVTVHFEGDSGLRSGFHGLFEPHIERARQQGIKFKLIAGKSGPEAVKDFLRSCELEPSNTNVLLIDSEGPVNDTASAIRLLRSQRYWTDGSGCADNQINFMVQAMEAWFVADAHALIDHFGKDFRVSSLPNPSQAESVPPDELVDVLNAGLDHGKRRKRKRKYGKVRDGVALLKRINADRVSDHCPHFRRLMNYLAFAI